MRDLEWETKKANDKWEADKARRAKIKAAADARISHTRIDPDIYEDVRAIVGDFAALYDVTVQKKMKAYGTSERWFAEDLLSDDLDANADASRMRLGSNRSLATATDAEICERFAVIDEKRDTQHHPDTGGLRFGGGGMSGLSSSTSVTRSLNVEKTVEKIDEFLDQCERATDFLETVFDSIPNVEPVDDEEVEPEPEPEPIKTPPQPTTLSLLLRAEARNGV